MKSNFYVISELSSKEAVLIEDENKIVVFSKRVPMLFWYDTYVLLANQKANVDKTLINGKFYKYVESACIDARLFKTGKPQLLLNK